MYDACGRRGFVQRPTGYFESVLEMRIDGLQRRFYRSKDSSLLAGLGESIEENPSWLYAKAGFLLLGILEV